jgi:hypothetical protein
MGGDYTRFTFDPWRHHSGVLLEQGRVQLDADLNELVEIVDRRERAQMHDLVGSSGVPRLSTKNGFLIHESNEKWLIGRGRIYVDGILAENHGVATAELEASLHESLGSLDTPIDEQPYRGTERPSEQLGGAGPHLVFLDVWPRERTAVEFPEVVEEAVGVDTSTRVQTAWQVRVLPDLPAGTSCAGELSELPGWVEATRPSAARLSSEAAEVPQPEDPCLVATSGGYRGRENRLYRVEVHDDGREGPLTLKWSRDNASVASRVTGIEDAGRVLGVERVGRDETMRFAEDQWVEVTDDARELDGRPGVTAQVKWVDDVGAKVTLDEAIDGIDVGRNARVRRWDQTKDLNPRGLIEPGPLPATIELEDGVRVELQLLEGGHARVGDYWVLAARTADASVEQLLEAPPRGPHHHYAPLAIVTNGNPEDCRAHFPPEPAEGGSCDCTACVSVEQQLEDPGALQRAVDRVGEEGGKICLQAGVYELDEPLRISGARSLAIAGKGHRTILLHSGEGEAVRVEGSADVTIRELSVLRRGDLGDHGDAGVGIAIANSVRARIERCYVVQSLSLLVASLKEWAGGGLEAFAHGSLRGGLAVGLAGALIDTAIRDCALVGEIGVGSLTAGRATAIGDRKEDARIVDYSHLEANRDYLLTVRLVVEGNAMGCARAGVDLGSVDAVLAYGKEQREAIGPTVHTGETRIANNEILGCAEAGIAALGRVIASTGSPFSQEASSVPLLGRLEVRGNLIAVGGDGIVVRGDATRVADNDVAGAFGGGKMGIAVNPRASRSPVRDCVVADNRLSNLPAGVGIVLLGPADDLRIAGNTVRAAGIAGIAAAEAGRVGDLTICGNQVRDVGWGVAVKAGFAAGIAVHGARSVDVSENSVERIATGLEGKTDRVGIRALGCERIRIASNQVRELGPAEEFSGTAKGIEITGSWTGLDVLDNRVEAPAGSDESSLWYALAIVSVLAVPAVTMAMFRQGRVKLDPGASDAERALSASLRVPAGASTFQVQPGREPKRSYVLTGLSVETIEAERSTAAVRGNLLDARGGSEAAIVAIPDGLSFQDNRCLLSTRDPEVAVCRLIGSDALIVDANQVEGPGELALDLWRENPQAEMLGCTVLGNVTRGAILLDGHALPPPWDQLNSML